MELFIQPLMMKKKTIRCLDCNAEVSAKVLRLRTHREKQGRRRRYGRSGHGRTTFLAENEFWPDPFLAHNVFISIFCRVIFSADLDLDMIKA